MLVNNEMEMKCLLSNQRGPGNCLEGMRKPHKTWSRSVGVKREIRTGHLPNTSCVNKVMRAIFYKTIYSTILVSQSFPLQTRVLLLQQTWPSEFLMPNNRVGSQDLLRSWWRLLKPSQHSTIKCLKTDRWLSISISGTSKNRTLINLENVWLVEARKCISRPENQEMTTLCVRARCRDPQRTISNSTRVTALLKQLRTSK
jgi:hypothetical protein